MDGGDQYFKKKKSCKNPRNAMCKIWMDKWKVTLTWHYHGSCKQITYVYGLTYGELRPFQLMSLVW